MSMKNLSSIIEQYRTTFESLLSLSKSVNYDEPDFISLDFEYSRVREKFKQLSDYFMDAKCSFDVDGFVYEYDDLPPKGVHVTSKFDLRPLNIKAYADPENLCKSMILTIKQREEPFSNLNRLYIVKDKIYNADDLITSFPDIKNTLDCYDIMKAFCSLSDQKLTESFIIVGGRKNLVEYSYSFEFESVIDVSGCKDSFLKATNSRNEELIQLLKSEINDFCGDKITKTERTRTFLSGIDAILNDFVIVRSNYLRDFESVKQRERYNDKETHLISEIKNSLQNLKAELLVFLSMFFAMSEVYTSNNIRIKFLVIISLFFAGIICCALLDSDRKQLISICDKIKEELENLRNVKEDKVNNQVINKFIKEFTALYKSSKRNIILLFVAQIASFLPLITSLIIMFFSNDFHSEKLMIMIFS